MTDILFPENWSEIDIDDYVAQHKLAFDLINSRNIPHYALLDKIRLRGLLLVLLTNDPLKNGNEKRERLSDAMSNEMQRQSKLLVAEYVERVENSFMAVDIQPKLFLEDFVNLPDKPPAQTVGMKTLDLGATIAR